MLPVDDPGTISPSHTSQEITAREGFLRCAPWIFFISSAAFLLRPVLLTAIAADDLINPFAQIYHAGTGIGPILRRTWDSVSATGHFNYFGQAFGSFVVSIWNYLIGNFGIRYSLVYATTKFLVYLLCIEVAARSIKHALAFSGRIYEIWILRIALLLAIALPIQIHIPWSNDPVASYPLSGYLTATIGVGYILLVFRFLSRTTLTSALLAGIYGASAVLYYEFNSFAILSVAPILGHYVWNSRTNLIQLKTRLMTSIVVVLPAATTTIYFYLKNRAASADYSGTAVSFASPFPKTFAQGMVSVLPGSSWNLAFEWLPNSLSFPSSYIKQFLVGVVLFLCLFLFRKRWARLNAPEDFSISRLYLVISPFAIYWLGSTFTQTSTVKVQQEALRIGQVYNYYAVGALCSAVIAILIFARVNWQRVNIYLKSSLVGILFFFGAFQFVVNWNVTTQFNGALSGNRNLLAVFADKPPMAKRCAALDTWKSMGWPEYYWLDMELGMNASYEIYHGEKFCER